MADDKKPKGDKLQKQEDVEERLVGTYRLPEEANDRLKYASKAYNLVSPATSVGTIREGCAVALAMVYVDTELDTYPTKGSTDRVLGKTTLQQISAAAGIRWDPIYSCRLDDCSDPYYVRWRAIGSYRAFDGQMMPLVANKELDLRPGSAMASDLSVNQLREMRLHIQSHAETKGQLRAIRSLGIKTAYTLKEIEKPFVCVRMVFTGETNDPILKAEFAKITATQFLDNSATLYGAAPPQLPAAAPILTPHKPPPVGATQDEEQPPRRFEPPPSYVGDAAGEDVPKPFVIPGGRAKGTPIQEAEIEDVEYWANRIGKELEDGKARYPERDKALHAAMVEELERRESPDEEF